MPYLSMISGIGGNYTETTLWTNSSPTSSFEAQDVALSDDMDNYDYLVVKYAYSTVENNNASTCIYSVEDFKKGVSVSETKRNMMSLGIINVNNQPHIRGVYYLTNTSIHFGGCYRVNYASTANSNAIPLSIAGLKRGAGSGGASEPNYYNSITVDSVIHTGANVDHTATEDLIVTVFGYGTYSDRYVSLTVNGVVQYNSGATDATYTTIIHKNDVFKFAYNHQNHAGMIWTPLSDLYV